MANNGRLVLVVNRRLSRASESRHLQVQQPLRAIIDGRSDVGKSVGQQRDESRMIDAFGHTMIQAGAYFSFGRFDTSHNSTLVSCAPDASRWPSGLKWMLVTGPAWPMKVCSVFFVATS